MRFDKPKRILFYNKFSLVDNLSLIIKYPLKLFNVALQFKESSPLIISGRFRQKGC